MLKTQFSPKVDLSGFGNKLHIYSYSPYRYTTMQQFSNTQCNTNRHIAFTILNCDNTLLALNFTCLRTVPLCRKSTSIRHFEQCNQ